MGRQVEARVASSRSFTRSLSIVAVAVVAFAALELLAVQQAVAGIVCCVAGSNQTDCLCDPSLVCSITKNGKFYGSQVAGRTCWNTSITGSASTIKSQLDCLSISEDVILSSTSLTRTGLLDCTVSGSTQIPPHDGSGRCQIDLSYSRPAGLTQCVNHDLSGTANDTSTRTWTAFCSDVTGGQAQNRLTAAGTLKCPATLQPEGQLPAFCQGNADCILNLGVTGEACNQVFPDDDGLVKGQVLSFSQTVKGLGCGDASDVVSFTELETRYCNSGLFLNAPGAPVDCVEGTGPAAQTLAGSETSTAAVQFDVTFSPTVLNVNCGTNNNDVWRFTIVGNQSLGNVSRIDTATLSVGVQGFPASNSVPGAVSCGAPVNNTLSCEVPACDPTIPAPNDLGTKVLELRNADKTVDLAVTGFLNAPSDDTAIVGVQHVTTSGQ
jgi:hypothetical protein